MNEIGEGMNEIYHCPLMKAKIFLKGNNTQENDNRKPFKRKAWGLDMLQLSKFKFHF